MGLRLRGQQLQENAKAIFIDVINVLRPYMNDARKNFSGNACLTIDSKNTVMLLVIKFGKETVNNS